MRVHKPVSASRSRSFRRATCRQPEPKHFRRVARRVVTVGKPDDAAHARDRPPRMKAPTCHGEGDIRCGTALDPEIFEGRDAIIKVKSRAICNSDLHLFDGVVPGMKGGASMAAW